jgi:glycosyltransferase involved in cell wall biosynthesis
LALIHDWLNQSGGAERVLEHLVDLYPGAPVYTSMYWREGMPEAYRRWDIRTSWMDRLPGIYRHHRWYFPLYALAFARLQLADEFDAVISNKSGFCHGVDTGEIPHLCYCLAPTRYIWEFESYAAREGLSPAVRLLLRPMLSSLRHWDYQVAQREAVHFVAISSAIQRRIRRYYDRASEIIFPPVDVERFAAVQGSDAGYYLIVSRLIPYKRIDLAVRAFTELGLPLLVAGEGRDRQNLEPIAGPTVKFLGHVPDRDVPRLMANCRAFVFPGREDFGIAPVEAQAAGRPVVAYGEGGALDTVLEGVTGAFFSEQTVTSLADVISRFDPDDVDPADCRRNARRFSSARYRAEIQSAVAGVLS